MAANTSIGDYGTIKQGFVINDSDDNTAETTDYDGDQLANLAEYALGGDPTNAASVGHLPTLLREPGGGFSYVHARRTDDTNLVYFLERSDNLVSNVWTKAGYASPGTNVTGGTFDFVTNTIPVVVDQEYVRLSVEKR